MTDPDDAGGSAADRRFRAELRRSLEAMEQEEGGTGTGAGSRTGAGAGAAAGPARTGTAAGGPRRSRADVFMDWAPLGVAVLAIGAVIGIALYGMNGGDLGPW